MAMMNSSAWNGGDHTMHAGEDFQQFLDMNMANLPDGLGFDFNGLDTPMDGTDMTPADPALQHRMPLTSSAAPYQTMPVAMVAPQTADETMVNNIEAQIRYLQQQKMQHQQRQLEEQQAAYFTGQQRRMVPPTPQSLELQPVNTHFYGRDQPLAQQSQQQTPQQAVDYRYRRLKDQQEIFTPLVSPAVTPLESHFPVDAQFGVAPGAYFSPLTSPALHAQTDPMKAVFEQGHGAVGMNSPDEMDLEASATSSAAKKSRRNPSATRSAKAAVGKSPIAKPQRRRTATTPNLQAQVLSELVEEAEQVTQQQRSSAPGAAPASSSSRAGTTDSENGSVSPQPLADVAPMEMPPPPVPRPRSHGTPTVAAKRTKSPATPASLMMLGSPAQGAAAVDTEHIETLELPGPVSAAADTHSGRSPVFGGTDQTWSRTPASAASSPQMLPGGASASSCGARTRTPQLLARGSTLAASTASTVTNSNAKKRVSVGSVHASPALRPKISPNLKPLLPGGATAEESASHLLATKSNYQRILEGNTVAGVSYPSELSTNLTSKRTSHKIAEQGRRNRINSALQEMALLLPRQPKDKDKGAGSDDGEGSAGGKGGAGGGGKDKDLPSSKASTVERAIEYIKQLKQEVAEANRRADEAESMLAHRG